MENKQDKGFTLVELLIVIVILGILATVTVFAVRGITDQGQENACDVEKRTSRRRSRRTTPRTAARPTPRTTSHLTGAQPLPARTTRTSLAEDWQFTWHATSSVASTPSRRAAATAS